MKFNKYNILSKVYRCFLLLSVIIVIFSSFSMAVLASEHLCEMCGAKHELSELGGFQKFAYNVSESVYGKEMFDDVHDYLKFEVSGNTNPKASDYKPMAALWEKAREFYKILLPVGSVLCVIYTSIQMFENMSQDTLTPENLAKHIIKILFAILMLNMGFDIITAFVDVANGAYDLLNDGLAGVKNGYSTSGATAGLCNFSTLKSSDFLEAIGVVFHLIIPYIAMKVAKIACFIVIWARVLEVIVRTTFAPLGLADLISGGRSSNGFKYLKRLFAALMVGVVLNAIMTGYTFIMSALGSGSFIIVLVITYTMITTILKASELSKDMIGV